jgi:hypothetical protein
MGPYTALLWILMVGVLFALMLRLLKKKPDSKKDKDEKNEKK